MRRFLNGTGAILLAVVLVNPGMMHAPGTELMAQAPSPETKVAPVEVKVVKYDGLKDAVKELKGKLVVVDFWSTT
jgi:hypothetical protein